MRQTVSYSLMIHGGAGTMDNIKDEKIANTYLQSIHDTLEQGRKILESGGSAIETAETCASLMEDNPIFNAGCGSVLNENGKVEMDAAIMDGRDLSAGAIAGVHNIANPIQLAKQVMVESEHVMLIAEGAMRFAEYCGIKQVPESYLLRDERIKQFNDANNKIVLDHDGSFDDEQKYGTIGAIVRDTQGNLAAATSTGGTVKKRLGRVGDSPIIGAGVYADNETCAVSATGYGEEFMRSVISKTIADFIYMKGMNAESATQAGIEYLTRKVKGRGGVIVIDYEGNCSSAFTTKKMIHGWIEHGGKTIVRF